MWAFSVNVQLSTNIVIYTGDEIRCAFWLWYTSTFTFIQSLTKCLCLCLSASARFMCEHLKFIQKPRVHLFINSIIQNAAGARRCATKRILCYLHFALWQRGKVFYYKFTEFTRQTRNLSLIEILSLNEICWNSFVFVLKNWASSNIPHAFSAHEFN